MNRATSMRALLAVAVLLLASAGGGFLRGALGSGGTAVREAGGEESTGPTPLPRAPALALRTLGTHGHWGRYTAAATPEDSAPAPVNDTRTAALDDLARAWRLVGIEQSAGRAHALLLPAGADDGETEAVRLGSGEELTEGIRVSAIGHDSVRFSTPGGSSTLYLYGTEP